MGRTPHDRLGKTLLAAVLERVGTAEISREVAGEVQTADVWFEPDAGRAHERTGLGLLGWLASQRALFEPFSGVPRAAEIRACLLKLFQIHAEEARARRRDRGRDSTRPTRLVLMLPTVPESLLEGIGAAEVARRQGVFSLAPWLCTLVTVADRLPPTLDTLWLRLLGRGETQRKAVVELLALPPGHDVRALAEREVVRWRMETSRSGRLGRRELEAMMNTEHLVEEWQRQILLKGREEGQAEGMSTALKLVLEQRFGRLPSRVERLAASLPPGRPAEEALRSALRATDLGELEATLAKLTEGLHDRDPLDADSPP